MKCFLFRRFFSDCHLAPSSLLEPQLQVPEASRKSPKRENGFGLAQGPATGFSELVMNCHIPPHPLRGAGGHEGATEPVTWGLWSPRCHLKPKDLSPSPGSVPRALLGACSGEEGEHLLREPRGAGVQGPWGLGLPTIPPSHLLELGSQEAAREDPAPGRAVRSEVIRGVGMEE